MVKLLQDIRLHDAAVVADLQNHKTIRGLYIHFDSSAFVHVSESVFDTVFYHRLQDDLGNLHLQNGLLHFYLILKQILISYLFYIQITFHMLQLIFKGNIIFTLADTDPQHPGQRLDQFHHRLVAIHPGKHMYIIQCVIQKMRIDLIDQ